MTSTVRRTPPPLPGALQVGLIALLLLLAGAGWALTGDRMAGMDAGPGTDLGGLGWFIVGWVTMTAAMMLPSTAPVVLAHARIRERRIGATAAFVAGYLVPWAAAGLLGYAIVEGVRSLDVGFLAWDAGGPYVAGGVILGGALYQLTAPKRACLRHCREPSMLLEHRRAGALRLGIEHGGLCVGCCWALMAALFALGAMSVGWMAFIAALIAAEKLLPAAPLANRGIAVLFAALGIAVAFAPEDVPGLTIPEPMRMEAPATEAAGASIALRYRANPTGLRLPSPSTARTPKKKLSFDIRSTV